MKKAPETSGAFFVCESGQRFAPLSVPVTSS